MANSPTLPTYKTAARVLEGDKGSGWRLAGWTLARTILIAPPMMLMGIDAKRAFIGAGLASGLMSVFVLLRIFDARATGLAGLKGRPHLSSSKRALCAGSARRPRRR
jgi:hypothetical protein